MRDLFSSERSTFCLIVLAIATVLALLGVLTGPEWVSVTGTLITFLVASKTASHYIETKAGATAPNSPTTP